jgi:hypothetical protein
MPRAPRTPVSRRRPRAGVAAIVGALALLLVAGCGGGGGSGPGPDEPIHLVAPL